MSGVTGGLVYMCSGGAGTGSALFNFWENNDCPLAYQKLLNTSSSGVLQYTESNAILLRNQVQNLFNTYAQTNKITNDITDPLYNPFQEKLLNLCLDPTLPGACESYLTSFCGNYSQKDIIGNFTLTNFCGCFVPSDSSVPPVKGSPGCFTGTGTCYSCTGSENSCKPLLACDQLCHRSFSVQKSNIQNGYLISCPQNVCAINDVIINSENSKIQGNINFNTICSGCQGLGCICIVSGVNISETMSSIGIGEDFNQFCGANSLCYETSGTGTVNVPCKVNIGDIPIKKSQEYPNVTISIIVGIVLFLTFIIFVTALIWGSP